MTKTIQCTLFAIVLLLLGVTFFLFPSAPSQPGTDRFSVVATIYPLAEFARQVGGDQVRVTTIVPSGVEPHDFEPTPKDLTAMYQAGLVLYNGGSIDAWVDNVAPSLQDATVLQMSARLPDLLHSSEEGEQVDGHFWLSPLRAKQEVELIRDALIEADPMQAQTYRSNAESYLVQLDQLHEEYTTGLAQCAISAAVTSHAAFGYLANDYGFQQIAIAGFSPDAEPSAGALAEVAKKAREFQVRYIFSETLASPKLAQTLAREIGVKTMVFNPIEGLTSEEETQGADYLSLMRLNLHNLRMARSCR